jgi:phosphoglycerate dehydrogenase-like enzyme
MEPVNVLVVSSIGEDALRLIADVSPRIKLFDSSKLWDAPDIITPERKGDFSSPEFDAMLARAEVIYGFRLPQNFTARAPRLKWFQCFFAGVDSVLDTEMVNSPVTITNMRGIHAVPVSEFALGLMFMLAKRAETCIQQKQQKLWKRYEITLLRSKTLGIVGFGSIGRELAKTAKALGMIVLATSRTAQEGDCARHVDTVLPTGQLNILLSRSDFVVLALPHTPETDKLIGEPQIRAMKPTAYLINVGRGTTVDEPALVRSLEERWIAGAGLDAFATEPLPPDSKLWSLANVILTPHVGANRQGAKTEVALFFCENLRRYLNGKKLFNIVNKKAGY